MLKFNSPPNYDNIYVDFKNDYSLLQLLNIRTKLINKIIQLFNGQNETIRNELINILNTNNFINQSIEAKNFINYLVDLTELNIVDLEYKVNTLLHIKSYHIQELINIFLNIEIYKLK